MGWRNARSLDVLRREVDRRWSNRDRLSDGTIGDAGHQARKSDHNKNAAGHVRARDIDDDLRGGESDPFWLAEHIRLLGKAGFGPLQNGGYVIYFGRIAGSHTGWEWRDYTGPNAHKTHIHVSVSRDAARYDAETSWGIADIPTTDVPKPRPPRIREEEPDDMPRLVHWDEANYLTAYDMATGRAVRRTLPNTSREAQLVGGGGIITKDGVPFEVTNNQFLDVYEDLGPA